MSFLAVSYNIFARSLGSSCIPWVLHVSPEWEHALKDRIGSPVSLWVKKHLTTEYKNHFHKNYHSGDKNAMRTLWARHIKSPDDIPPQASGVSYISEDRVGYLVDGELKIATTLHGLIAATMPDLADELFKHIVRDEEHYLWANRGPKIFENVAGAIPTFGASPDLAVLTEYDIHTGESTYREGFGLETFPQAMFARGFAGALMQAPLEKEMSGLGVFWKRSEFELYGNCEELREGNAPSSEDSCIFKLPTGASYCGAYNFDLHEHCHGWQVTEEGSRVSIERELHVMDRKNAFFIKLRHMKTNKVVLVVGLHLMTDSRDCVDTNEYPGEVRGNELNTIGNILRDKPEISEGVDSILMMGDFNIDVAERDIMKGRLKSCLDSSELLINTWFDDATSSPKFDFNSDDLYLPKRHLQLVEAFSDTHKWGEEVGEGQLCSSYNSKRCSWIDMIWHSESTLVVDRKSTMETPCHKIPNRAHGSDHLPLYVQFRWD